MPIVREIFTAKDCLANVERSRTPPKISKYRNNVQPGRKYIHYGLSDDISSLNLDKKVFGVTSECARHTVADLIQNKQPTQLQQIENQKAENVYKSTKREMLGCTVDRGLHLPIKFSKDKVPFGVPSKCIVGDGSNSARDVIFPKNREDDTDENIQIYIKTHHAYRPGEQASRHYKWPMNPKETRFGIKGGTDLRSGASPNLTEIFSKSCLSVPPNKIKDNGDIIDSKSSFSKSSRPSDYIYGTAYTRNRRTVGEIIHGYYSPADQLPDKDLGTSLTPGYRNNADSQHVFGAPSSKFRTAPMLKDDYDPTATAGALIHSDSQTSIYHHESIKSTKKDDLTKQKIIELYRKIDVPLDQKVVDRIFVEFGLNPSSKLDKISLSKFQWRLNELMEG